MRFARPIEVARTNLTPVHCTRATASDSESLVPSLHDASATREVRRLILEPGVLAHHAYQGSEIEIAEPAGDGGD